MRSQKRKRNKKPRAKIILMGAGIIGGAITALFGFLEFMFYSIHQDPIILASAMLAFIGGSFLSMYSYKSLKDNNTPENHKNE